jgi:hypothetical protein
MSGPRNARRLSIPEDAAGSLKDLLIDVSGSQDDFRLPAEAHALASAY